MEWSKGLCVSAPSSTGIIDGNNERLGAGQNGVRFEVHGSAERRSGDRPQRRCSMKWLVTKAPRREGGISKTYRRAVRWQ